MGLKCLQLLMIFFCLNFTQAMAFNLFETQTRNFLNEIAGDEMIVVRVGFDSYRIIVDGRMYRLAFEKEAIIEGKEQIEAIEEIRNIKKDSLLQKVLLGVRVPKNSDTYNFLRYVMKKNNVQALEGFSFKDLKYFPAVEIDFTKLHPENRPPSPEQIRKAEIKKRQHFDLKTAFVGAAVVCGVTALNHQSPLFSLTVGGIGMGLTFTAVELSTQAAEKKHKLFSWAATHDKPTRGLVIGSTAGIISTIAYGCLKIISELPLFH